jgi:Protein of unknown function (DUF732)
MKQILSALVLTSLALLTTQARAHADGAADDQAYVNLLTGQGIPVTSTAHARAGGLAVCEALEMGQSVDHVATEVMESNPAITRDQARLAVTDAQPSTVQAGKQTGTQPESQVPWWSELPGFPFRDQRDGTILPISINSTRDLRYLHPICRRALRY